MLSTGGSRSCGYQVGSQSKGLASYYIYSNICGSGNNFPHVGIENKRDLSPHVCIGKEEKYSGGKKDVQEGFNRP